jgi:hypothetical protein
LRDEIFVLETNLDDVTGETVGHTVDRLFQEGARDVCAIPMFTKKIDLVCGALFDNLNL